MKDSYSSAGLLSSKTGDTMPCHVAPRHYLYAHEGRLWIMALGMAIGVAMGAAIGVGIDNLPIGIAIGIGAGIGYGFRNGF